MPGQSGHELKLCAIPGRIASAVHRNDVIARHEAGLLRGGILQNANQIHGPVQERGLLAAAHVNPGDKKDGEDDVHGRTGQSDQHSLPPGLGEKLIGVALAFFERVVAGHLHVAAEGQSADAIIGVAALESPEARAEADGKHLDANAK